MVTLHIAKRCCSITFCFLRWYTTEYWTDKSCRWSTHLKTFLITHRLFCTRISLFFICQWNLKSLAIIDSRTQVARWHIVVLMVFCLCCWLADSVFFFPTYYFPYKSEYFPNVSLNSCFAIDNGGFVIVHPDYISGSPPSAAEHIMFKEPAIATELVNNGILYNDSCVDIINIDLQFFWKVWAVISLLVTTNAYRSCSFQGWQTLRKLLLFMPSYAFLKLCILGIDCNERWNNVGSFNI